MVHPRDRKNTRPTGRRVRRSPQRGRRVDDDGAAAVADARPGGSVRRADDIHEEAMKLQIADCRLQRVGRVGEGE